MKDPQDNTSSNAPDHGVIVVGTGLGGIGAAAELREAGITDYRVLDGAHVARADWDAQRRVWRVALDSDPSPATTLTARFLIGATGGPQLKVPDAIAGTLTEVSLLRRALTAVLSLPLPATRRTAPGFPVHGADGAQLPTGRLGVSASGFPNLFLVTGATGHAGADAAAVIATCTAGGATAVELASPDARTFTPGDYRYLEPEPEPAPEAVVAPPEPAPAAKKTPAKKISAGKATAAKTPAKKTPAKNAAAKAPAKKAAAKAPAKAADAPAKATPKKAAAPAKKTPAKKAAPRKASGPDQAQ
jgi:hypothetical protein